VGTYLIELQEDGLATKTERTRRTQGGTGLKAIVYVATEQNR